MEGSSSFLTGEASYVTPKACSDIRIICQKLAETLVVMKADESQKERMTEQSYQLLESRLCIIATSGVYSTLLKSMVMAKKTREE